MNISADFINENTNFSALISALRNGFEENSIIVPMRHHHEFPNAYSQHETTMLLMPAWNPKGHSGVKVVSVSPDNYKYNLPAIQGSYLFMDSKTGQVKALIEAKALTVKRTAAASALAADYLAKKEASTLLMIGTGALAPNLIKAHASIRPIKTVYVWGRNLAKAKAVCETLQDENFKIHPVETIESHIAKADIISCATLSGSPLVLGKHLRAGQHIDLVGAYNPSMRESDDEAIKASSVFVDTLVAGTRESGDIVIPLKNGTITLEDIQADLFQLCSNTKTGRTSDEQITLFKSVGHALEDLVAAEYYFEKMMQV